MTRYLLILGFVLGFVSSVSAENLVVNHVKIHRHRSEKDRRLVDKVGTLTFDDSAKTLTFNDDVGDSLHVNYADVDKVIFEVTSHMRGGGLAQAIGGVAGTIIAGQHVNDYWMYVALAPNKGEPFLMEVQKDSSEETIDKAKAVFAERVTIADFAEKDEEVDKSSLKDLQSKETAKADKKAHPLPELKPDKALVVVVCPPLAARDEGLGTEVKLHANDHVIAVNRQGTYGFAYLDPGKYKLVSQSENADGFEMELEAGKDYYFLQNTFQGTWKAHTALSRNTKELVMYLLDGAYYSDWKEK